MTLTVLFFAQARDHSGCSQSTLELPDGSLVSDAIAALSAAHPGLGSLLPHLAVAVNGQLARPGVPIPAGAELALLPPVSGG